ncbi:MAG TPA: hypothetical protein PKX25_07160, partial [Microthrixaceae bacterium]|nr:hypothetical protein [Microthrixaceae bacterium]
MARAGRERLLIENCGEEHALSADRTLTFGRSADVVVDINPYLHRVLGRFRHDGRSWWLDNVGRSIPLTLLSIEGLSSATVGPGSSTPILAVESAVTFSAGPASYELVVT